MKTPVNCPPWKIFFQGDRTLLLTLDGPVSVEGGRLCALAANALRAAGLPGATDVVPAFNSVAMHFQPRLFGPSTSFKNLAGEVVQILEQLATGTDAPTGRSVDIPVCYGGEHGPDLQDVARACGLSEAEVIRLHTDQPAYVFMLGFAPGAPYMGMLDHALDIARRTTPRTAVPAGSVAIANRQTIIYPHTSPGGWHIIGATPATLFFPEREPPTLLAPGDTVRFVPVDADEFKALSSS